MNEIELWAIYIRVSTEEQATEGFSLQTQINKAKKLIEEENGEVFEIYADEGLSGSDSMVKRPGILKLLSDAKKKKFHGLAIFKADRLSRMSEEREQIIQALIRYGIKIKALSGENLTDNTPQGEFIRKTLANIDELEVKTLSFRIKNTLSEKANRGDYLGGKPPYGLIWNQDKKQMERIEKCIEEIKLIYNLYVNELKGCSQILSYLNKNNIPYHKDDKIERWNKERILGVLKAPIYCGYQWYNTRYSKFDKVEGKKFKDKSEWILMDANFVEPIILKDEWERAQEIREQRTKKLIPQTKTQWLLSGVLYCSNCGSLMQGHPHWNKYTDKEGNVRKYDCSSYICFNRVNNGSNVCNAKQVVKKNIETEVVSEIKNRIKTLLIDKNKLQKILKELLMQNLKSDKKEFSSIDNELQKIDRKIQKYYTDYEDGKIEAEVLSPAIKRLKTQKEELLSQQESIEDKVGNFESIVDVAIGLADSLSEWDQNFNDALSNGDIGQQKVLLLKIVKKINVSPDIEELDIDININPYVFMKDTLQEVPHKHIWENAISLLKNIRDVV